MQPPRALLDPVPQTRRALHFNRVSKPSIASPIEPNRRPRSPARSRKPRCSRAGAVTRTPSTARLVLDRWPAHSAGIIGSIANFVLRQATRRLADDGSPSTFDRYAGGRSSDGRKTRNVRAVGVKQFLVEEIRSAEDRWRCSSSFDGMLAFARQSQCDEARLQFASQESLMQCMMQAPPYIAQWAERASGDARHQVALRLSRSNRREDLIGDCHRPADGAQRRAYRSRDAEKRLAHALDASLARAGARRGAGSHGRRPGHHARPRPDLAGHDDGRDVARRSGGYAQGGARGRQAADFTGKRLSGLDLSGLDLSRRNLARCAAQPHEPLARQARPGDAGSGLGAWRRSHWRQPRQARACSRRSCRGADLDGADFTGARIDRRSSPARISTAADCDGANGAADEKNQSMGLMRALIQIRGSHPRGFLATPISPAPTCASPSSPAPISQGPRCATPTPAARICAARFFRAPTRLAWTSIPRASTRPASRISRRRSTSIAPIASDWIAPSQRRGSKISPLPRAARSPARRVSGRRNRSASFALACPT